MIIVGERINSYIGFAQKAGKVLSGDKAVWSALNRGRVYLLIIAIDASDRTKRDFNRYCDENNIPSIEYGTKDSLGRMIGKMPRAVVAILDEQFAMTIGKNFGQDVGTKGK